MSHEILYQPGSFPPRLDIFKVTPEVQTHQMPVLMAPGLGSDIESNKLLMDTLALRGFRSFGPSYEYGLPGEPRKFRIFHDVGRVKQEALLAAIQAEGFIDADGIRKVDVITHSKASINIALLAARHPEHFRTIVMIAPTGIRPHVRLLKGIRQLNEGNHRDQKDKGRLMAEGGEVAKRVLASDAYAASFKKNWRVFFPDVYSSATGSILDIIQQLRQKGIKIVIVAQTDDAYYDPKSYRGVEVDKLVESEGIHSAIKFKQDACERVVKVLEELEAAA